MTEKPYPFYQTRTEYRYEFTSVSSLKEIPKVVLITQTETPKVFNVALLDILEDGNMSDVSVGNNDDLKTILATVIKIIEDFLNKNEGCFVVFRGSDERRQRLYRVVVSREFKEITNKFQVWGGTENEIVLFVPNTDYEYFLIEKR